MATITEVMESFTQARTSIAALDQALADERSNLKLTAFHEGRPLTPTEVARRKEIAATRQELAESVQTLAMETIDALESASDVDGLLQEINAINQQLEDDLAHLNTIVEFAEKAGKVASGLAKITEKLIALRPSLG